MTFRPQLVSISGFVFAALLGVAAALVLTGTFPKIDRNIGLTVAVFAIVSFGSAVFSHFTARGRVRSGAQLRRAAATRGFGFIGNLADPGFKGLLFREGTGVQASDLVDARESATPFLAGSVVGQYANDTSTPRVVGASFIMIPLPTNVPNIVLVAKKLGPLRQAGLSLVGRQRLSLEGDFDRNFTLYCPVGYERDALYIFAPDLMQLFIETTAGCDVELVDDTMYVYSAPGRYRDEAAIDNLVRVAERVQGKLRRQTVSYADDRAAAFTNSGVSAAGVSAAVISTEGASAITASAVAASGSPASGSPASDNLAPAGQNPRTVSPEDHAAGAGKVGTGGRRLRTKTTLLQKLVTVGTTVLLIVSAIFAVIHYLPIILSR